MKRAIVCLMALYAFEIVFADLNSDFLKQVKDISLSVEKDINTRVATANRQKIKIGNCKDIATVALQDALFKRQQQEQSCIKGKKPNEMPACPRKAIADLNNDVKPIGPNLQNCINNCTKTKKCSDD